MCHQVLVLAGKPIEAEQVYRRAILIAGDLTPAQPDMIEQFQRELKAIKAGTFSERNAKFIHEEAAG